MDLLAGRVSLVKTVSSGDLRVRFGLLGVDPQSSSVEQFAGFMRSETAKWAKVVKDAGIPRQ